MNKITKKYKGRKVFKKRLKFGNQYYNYGGTLFTKTHAENRVNILRKAGLKAQFVKRKSMDTGKTVYRIYKRKKGDQNTKN